MTLATVAMPSPLIRTTLPGVARAMPRHPVRQVMASTTGRGAASDAAAAGTGRLRGGGATGAGGRLGECRPRHQRREHERGDGDRPQGSGQA